MGCWLLAVSWKRRSQRPTAPTRHTMRRNTVIAAALCLAAGFGCYLNFIHGGWVNDAWAGVVRLSYYFTEPAAPVKAARVAARTADEDVQMAALEALGQAGDARAIDAVVDLYDRTDSRELRKKALFVLASAESRRAARKV